MVTSPQTPSPSPPALGTYIDNGSLQLVEILGYGGYGIVYRAVDTFSANPTSYAVKCLPHSTKRNATRQRQLHLREITLHQLASGHPNVVTLHRVIEDYQYTFIIMDYCSDGDLFTQILHQRRYLGNNALIKEVFLQLLDAVEYCHSLNIYHRDLKPENILCFDGGLRLAVTDFGLATTERMSTEFRTGSVYHMSPECQGGYFAPTRSYSPLFNDVWSLGIILLNLITGRNPWKSASADDCTFQAYLKDPLHFLPSVLPISEEVNVLLTRVLEVDWRRRITLREMRLAFKAIDNFYSKDVVFEDSMARCPWEAGVAAEHDSDSSAEAEPEPQELPEQPAQEDFTSAWSHDSDSQMVFARDGSVAKESSWDASSASYAERRAEESAYSRSMSPSPSPSTSPAYTTTQLFEALRTPGQSPASQYSVLSSSPSIPSMPVTPHGGQSFAEAQQGRPKLVLTLNTSGVTQPEYYDNSVTMLTATASSMRTALESALESQWDGYTYTSPISAFSAPTRKASLRLDSREDVGMIMTPATEDHDLMDAYPTIDDSESALATAAPSSVLGLDFNSTIGHETATHDGDSDYSWKRICSWLAPSHPSPYPSTTQTPAFSFLSSAAPSSQTESVAWPAFSFGSSGTTSSGGRSVIDKPSPVHAPARRKSTFLNPIRLAFPRRSLSPAARSRSPAKGKGAERVPRSAPATYANWVFSASTSASPEPQPYLCLPPAAEKAHPAHETLTEDAQPRRKRQRLRSARDWFSPGKLFAAVLPS